ncbi:MAG: hypothetical protein Pars2KO_17090 [Parasphingorhabdus sp.]
MSFIADFKIRIAVILLALFMIASAVVYAQLEGGERGVAPLASTGDFEVYGVDVDVTGDDSFDARKKGWEEAQRKAWRMLYQRTQGGKTSGLSDGALNNMVSAIIVEQEQIGPKRYIATLGVMFDRARAGSILGVGGRKLRSPPLLVLPIMWSGGSAQVFENRTEWQKAWARFKAGDSAIDYVRPHGSDSESLVLTAGQADRRSRLWWRNILDQFGAADVIIPIARLKYEYPGGPVTGQFTARYGPDNKLINNFTLKVDSSDKIPEMMEQAISRFDNIYTAALSRGVLKTDKSLIIEDSFDLSALEAELEAELGLEEVGLSNSDNSDGDTNGGDASSNNADSGAASNAAVSSTSTISVQYDTPDVGAVGRGESSLRSLPGVTSAATSSLALGGVSVMRVTYSGDINALAGALRSRGWQVQQGAGALRISRGGSSQPTPSPANNGAGSEEPEQ